jgi:DNA-binding transcriptional regulator YiaG
MGEKKPKYRNKKTEVNGILFDSKAESEYYVHLMELKTIGVVKEFTLQPKYEVLPAFHGQKAVHYIADFRIEYNNGSVYIVDIKGHETAEFKIKRKMYEYLRFGNINPPPPLLVISNDPKYGWIELDKLKEIKSGKAKRPPVEWGAWIKANRKAAGIYAKDLAEALGVSEQTVNGWEQGRRKPRSGAAKRLTEYFKSKPPGY